jgi:UDP-2-acetamido-3-amino-2,3-dideoxy-glucuronate N-acetyltransferase
VQDLYIHPTATVEQGAEIGRGAKIWHYCHIRAGSKIGPDCSIGKDSYVDSHVTIGEGSRIQNGVSLFRGVEAGRFVFIGPHVVFTNDLYPRAGVKEWTTIPTFLRDGCALGAGAVIRCGIELGAFSMVAAGAILTKDLAPFTLAVGTPATPTKKICACGRTQFEIGSSDWKPILGCCEAVLQDAVLKVARQYI